MDTTQTTWHEHLLPRPDFQLAYYESGTGPIILFLSGGPGDDHNYLCPVANPLTPHFRCVLYDQRGTGRSLLNARSIFYSPEAIESHRTFFSTHYSLDPITAKYVSEQIFPTLAHIQLWERLSSVTAAMLVLYGYQDFEPITQAYLLKERIPHAQLCFLNECGHLPWLEQSAKFYQALEKFLGTYAR